MEAIKRKFRAGVSPKRRRKKKAHMRGLTVAEGRKGQTK